MRYKKKWAWVAAGKDRRNYKKGKKYYWDCCYELWPLPSGKFRAKTKQAFRKGNELPLHRKLYDWDLC